MTVADGSRFPRHRLCGVGDEAAVAAEDQIAAIAGLGWRAMELRTVGGVALAELDEPRFETLTAQLREAKLAVPVLCSRIGSWFKPNPGAFEDDLRELAVLVRRAKVLGARYIRIMSFPAPALDDTAARALAHDRICRLADVARAAGLVLVHENCVGWAGGAHPERVLELIEAAGSDALAVLFDVGNGLAYGYDSVALLTQVLPHVAHVHVKDGRRGTGGVTWVLPGEGEARVVDCLSMLLAAGYDGLFSVEPHILTVPHLGLQADATQGRRMFAAYGESFAQLLDAIHLSTRNAS